MTELSEKILKSYQVRKTKSQKDAFIELLRQYYPELHVETGGLGKPRNLVIGDVEKAKVIFTAHYDTCAELPIPNFITPLNIPLYLLYQLLITAPVIVLMLLAMHFGQLWSGEFLVGYLAMWLVFAAFMWLLVGGKANPHTVNDNTSGVITLCETLASMTSEEREKAAFVFFDLEEAGLFGSSQFAKVHKKAMKNKLLVNFDCVSDGDHLLVVYKKKVGKMYGDVLQEVFCSTTEKETVVVSSAKAFYPSDQSQFPYGVGVAALKKKKGVGLYMDKIHTKRDTVFDERNIIYFSVAARRLTTML